MSFHSRRDALSLIAAVYGAAVLLPAPVDALSAFAIPPDLRYRIDKWAGSTVPGVSVAWIDDNKHGIANYGEASNRVFVDDKTVFEAASLSKPAFSLGVLALVARGMLDLDRPIAEIVDLRRETDDSQVLKITPRHSLTHTTGLPNWRFRPDPLRCRFVPGTRFSYSGEGIFLLQRAVEHITGTGLAAYMRETVLVPLGMSSSTFAYEHWLQRRLAAPHDASGKPLYHRTVMVGKQLLDRARKRHRPLEQWTWQEMQAVLPLLDPPQRPLPVFSPINAASSLLTTAHDYTRIVGAMARRHEMTTPRVSVAPEIAWGLGVGVETGADQTVFHWGDNDGFKAMMVADTKRMRGAVVLTNSDAGMPVAAHALRALIGADHPLLVWVEAMYR